MLVWMVAAMVVVNQIPEATTATTRSGFVSAFEKHGWYYFMVSGYAMNTTGEYNSTIAPSMCVCRSRCDVNPSCHAVSIIPLAAGDTSGQTECRTSTYPEILSEKLKRPWLEATEGAYHILRAEAGDQKLPQYNDGLYYNQPASEKTWHAAGCPLAVARTPGQLEILKMELEQLPASANSKMYVGLRRDANGSPVWDFGSHTEPYTLDSGLIEDSLPSSSPAVFYLTKDAGSGEYKFVASDANTPLRVLCQRNHLNIIF
ncbi:uncharacterized protein LOC125041957 [Penaeus chinensis]|uniref:uncharacterized protein LOC125041957 n=1 Tax=Penaeus chinensis TaxID=139456 RepID=UPI001FB85718|nr:uncharacterized protein LOC125041957 [Penaeus chinensis]